PEDKAQIESSGFIGDDVIYRRFVLSLAHLIFLLPKWDKQSLAAFAEIVDSSRSLVVVQFGFPLLGSVLIWIGIAIGLIGQTIFSSHVFICDRNGLACWHRNSEINDISPRASSELGYALGSVAFPRVVLVTERLRRVAAFTLIRKIA